MGRGRERIAAVATDRIGSDRILDVDLRGRALCTIVASSSRLGVGLVRLKSSSGFSREFLGLELGGYRCLGFVSLGKVRGALVRGPLVRSCHRLC